MKKLLFVLIAFMTISTVIYASFPVTQDNTIFVDSNDEPTEAPAEDCVDWPLFVMCLFFGFLGLHRFMTGDALGGILMILTAGGCGIWWLIDVFSIAMCKMSR